MGKLLKTGISTVGLAYLALHLAHGLVSAVEAIGRHRREAKRATSSGLNRRIGRDASFHRRHTVDVAHKTQS